MRLSKFLIVLSASASLVACATIVDTNMQKVTIVTPGASESKCYADNGIRYPFRGGDTVEIQRSKNDLVIECYGSGNRYKKKVVPSTINGMTAANVSNAVVPGTTYDVFSGASWEYPDTIEVDFIGMPTTGYELPDYHNKDLPNPYDQAVEDFGPNTPRIESDRGYVPRTVEKRDAASMSSNPFSTFGAKQGGAGAPADVTPMPPGGAPPVPAPSTPSPKGTTAEELTRSMNPSVFN